MPDKNLEKQVKKTYLAMINNSVGTRIFNNAYVKNVKTGKILDVLNDGEFSCAFFVSGILTLVGLMNQPHSTVKTLVKKLQENEKWSEIGINNLEPGDVLVWETIKFQDGSKNEHVGFYVGNNKAVSTDYRGKQVSEHSFDFKGERKIVRIFQPKL